MWGWRLFFFFPGGVSKTAGEGVCCERGGQGRSEEKARKKNQGRARASNLASVSMSQREPQRKSKPCLAVFPFPRMRHRLPRPPPSLFGFCRRPYPPPPEEKKKTKAPPRPSRRPYASPRSPTCFSPGSVGPCRPQEVGAGSARARRSLPECACVRAPH